jgi:predicted lipoprotein
MRAGRRAFLWSLSGLSLTAVSGGCRQPDAREQALRATLQRVLLPDARAISQTSRALQLALSRLPLAGSEPALAEARVVWRSAALAWQRGVAFQHGPYVKTEALLRASFWPVRTSAIADVLLGAEPIDAHRAALFGVDIKGIFAIEHLLFEGEAPGVPWLLGPKRARALALVRALADDVCSYAERGSVALGDGEPFMSEFARAGQLSINRLVNQLLGTVETAAMRVERVVAPRSTRGVSLQDVQGGPSGTSTEVLIAWLSVCQRVYGAGTAASLASLVEAVAPAIHRHAEAAFSAALAGLMRLGRPIERAAQTDPAQLSAALQALRQLEVALRSELVSALGVTISFSSRDGD